MCRSSERIRYPIARKMSEINVYPMFSRVNPRELCLPDFDGLCQNDGDGVAFLSQDDKNRFLRREAKNRCMERKRKLKAIGKENIK